MKLVKRVCKYVKRWLKNRHIYFGVFWKKLRQNLIEKAFGKKARPKIAPGRRKSLNANKKAYYCHVVEH